MTPLTASERETIVRWDEENDSMEIFTASNITRTIMNKLLKSSPDAYSIVRDNEGGTTYMCKDKNMLTLRNSREKRELTPEQKQAQAERIKKMHEKKKENKEKKK